MPKNKLSSEKRFIRNFLIGFFSVLFVVLAFAIIALFQILISYPRALELSTVMIQSCYDGDTCTTTKGDKLRLACIETPELRGKLADPIPGKAADLGDK